MCYEVSLLCNTGHWSSKNPFEIYNLLRIIAVFYNFIGQNVFYCLYSILILNCIFFHTIFI